MDTNDLLANNLAWCVTDAQRIAAELDAAEARGHAAAIEQITSGQLRIEALETQIETRTVALALAHIAEMLKTPRSELQFSSGASGYYSALNSLRSRLNDALPDSRRSGAA